MKKQYIPFIIACQENSKRLSLIIYKIQMLSGIIFKLPI